MIGALICAGLIVLYVLVCLVVWVLCRAATIRDKRAADTQALADLERRL